MGESLGHRGERDAGGPGSLARALPLRDTAAARARTYGRHREPRASAALRIFRLDSCAAALAGWPFVFFFICSSLFLLTGGK